MESLIDSDSERTFHVINTSEISLIQKGQTYNNCKHISHSILIRVPRCKLDRQMKVSPAKQISTALPVFKYIAWSEISTSLAVAEQKPP